jgi:hypothetical protein
MRKEKVAGTSGPKSLLRATRSRIGRFVSHSFTSQIGFTERARSWDNGQADASQMFFISSSMR